jgi:hypothetical protein
MIDITSPDLIPLEEAASVVKVHFTSVYRWVLRGVPGPDGQRVRLAAVKLAGRWLTTRAALQEFAERTTPRFDEETLPAPRSPGRRQRASERAAAELARIGI